MSENRLWVAGVPGDVVDVLQGLGGLAVESGLPEAPTAADSLLLGFEGLEAFGTCLRLKKEQPRCRIHLWVEAGDPYAAEIARFCLADGVVSSHDELSRVGVGPREGGGGRPRIDELLERAEAEMERDASGRADAAERLLHAHDDQSLVVSLSDEETGLFHGEFAAFKLDEELKRANRFHQPLSVVLLDTCVPSWPEDEPMRKLLLAELASIFLEGCRDIDVLARFTSTVFLFLLPGTGHQGAEALARRLDNDLREREFRGDPGLDPAFGVVTVPLAGVKDRSKLLAIAEQALRTARESEGSARIQVEPA